MSEYAQLLKSPHWQKKRLEILKSRDFTCESCGETEKELVVHHCWYEKGKKPWEYPDDCYKVFCNECHSDWHEAKSSIDKIIATYHDISEINDLLIGNEMSDGFLREIAVIFPNKMAQSALMKLDINLLKKGSLSVRVK